MRGAMSGIRVIELSQVLAAPFCGYQFALLGAEVIKVELPDAPDCARGRGPLPELNARGVGLNYQVQGGNKQSLALDIRTGQGRAALLRLIEGADVFLENYTTGTLEALGLGHEALSRINPRLVYCSMTGYGESGPKATTGAYDNTIQAASGIIAQSGGHKPGVSFVDYAAGYSAAFAISAALLQRERTGAGCHISASMLEVALSLMSPEAATKQLAPETAKHKEAGISTFDTAEGRLMLGAFKPSQYRKLGSCLLGLGHEVPLLSEIHDWPDAWTHGAELQAALQEIFLQRSAAVWQAILQAADVPAERLVSLEEAVAAPQLSARGYFAPSPADPSVTLPLAGFKMSQGGAALHSAPPELGQDSRAVLAGAGLGEAEIDALFAEGIAK